MAFTWVLLFTANTSSASEPLFSFAVIADQYWHYSSGGYNVGQLRWMQQDLAKTRKPFKFVFGHEPACPIANHVGNSLDSNVFRRDEFWTILENIEKES